MESTVTIPLEEYRRLKGLDEQFDDQIKAARANAEATDRTDVLRDRDTYIRENEKLRNENSKLRDAVDESAGMNVKLLLEFHDVVRKARKNNEELNKTVTRLREERAEALVQRDALLERGLFARIFNRRR